MTKSKMEIARMGKWETLGQAFEDIGTDLMYGCESMETNCEVNEDCERMYILYVMLLNTLKAQRKFTGEVFDEIDE